MYFIKDLTDNQVINAPTEEIAKKLFKKFSELELKWYDGDPYEKETYWDSYGKNTCYRPYVGGWCDKLYYLERNYEILTVDQLLDFKEVSILDQSYLESAEYYANIAALWVDKLPEEDRYKRVKDFARRFHGAIVDELSMNNLK